MTPIDVLRPSVPRADAETRIERLDICHSCDRLHMGVCGICHCVMRVKVTLAPAECPIGKWGAVT